MKYKLYGDGIHDDYPAIREMLDGGAAAVKLPVPEKCYVISNTLKVHSNQTFELEGFTRIMLADGANCVMITNANPHNDKNICVRGGVWDMNHYNQFPNPYHFVPGKENDAEYCKNPKPDEAFVARWHGNARTSKYFLEDYSGMAMQFNGIENFTLSSLTIKNPVVYGVQMAHLNKFTVENITFDYTEGSPKLWNLDGVHFEGGCRNGFVRNLRGNCHDDTVAITADDSLYGEISDIVVDGIVADGPSHSAVRILSHGLPVRNIVISNVFGRFYTYCVGITKYYGPPEERGKIENVCINNVFGSNCDGTKDVGGGGYPFVFIEGGLDINNLSVSNVFRKENFCSRPLLYVGENTKIERLDINSVKQKNETDSPIGFLENNGEIGKLTVSDADNDGAPIISGKGKIFEKNI